MEHEPPAAADDPAVTLSIVRRVRPGREREYEQLLQATLAAAEAFPGFLGARLFRPAGGDRQYRTVLRFDRESSLRAWEESEPRQRWLDAAAGLTEADARVANITGTAQERPLAMALTPLEDFVRTSVS
nr:antibiotic biosynthesis monooxygenase [Chloroflexia bacterium]